ncbi:hypothetical protein IFM89_028958 [Coptis chinensis]|uniref:Crooked neck protein n=1 Tax=Coptis chinensis TaxID=261450 RepID=A0A835IGT8_9MAGN|nr:hypothetical protein IFM89_028958 [Coptis chinensis]
MSFHPRSIKSKNKSSSSMQISAEQLVVESHAHGHNAEIQKPVKHKITDSEELLEYRLQKRKEFEDKVRGRSKDLAVWIRYAQWEVSQKDFSRARSVWERALHAGGNRNPSIWLKYAHAEMENKFINHARNIWDRAVTLLPRVDQLWYKYVHLEEMLGNVAAARQIFDRWMQWMPDNQGWMSFVKFELRYGEVDRARQIFERYVNFHPKVVQSWIKYAQFELKNGDIARARRCFERGVENLDEDDDSADAEQLFKAFAEFEEGCKEVERARCIYRFALSRLPKGRGDGFHGNLLEFEKQNGDMGEIEEAIVGKTRIQYEEEVRKSPLNYDAWFDYIRLEEGIGNKERIREVYERAIANVPPAEEKSYWQRYIYLWINYALYEELDAQDMDRTREVYKQCLNLIPHHKFSFAKIWLLAAQFEIRQKNLNGARKLFGNSIGRAAEEKIFKKYIEIEMQIGDFRRCRALYERYLEWAPHNCYAWLKYAELEHSLCESERARAIFELAVAQPALDMPELLWKKYIDFEISEGENERVRQLYERLLDRTKNLKVWISFAHFEATASMEGCDMFEKNDQASLLQQRQHRLQRTRRVFERALNHFRTSAPELEEERAMLLEEWLNTESSFGDIGNVGLVQNELPKRLKKSYFCEWSI